jgi:hypothetical protein
VEQKKLIIILADISGYTRFMLENQTAALHGQIVITKLIETILEQVDIPLTLQEIEGDAVFLYAAREGSDEDWQRVVEEVSRKLESFFDAFMKQSAVMIESTPCACAICRNSEKLGLKIIVHAGEAVFHSIAGRAQVSGADVILAHRLLKNSVASREYLLVSDAAYQSMAPYLPGTFTRKQETYEGFGVVNIRVRLMNEELLAARDALYRLSQPELVTAVNDYTDLNTVKNVVRATVEQLRHPIRQFTWREKAAMVGEALLTPLVTRLFLRRSLPGQMMARGKRRTSWSDG